MLAENALECETITQGRAARRFIQRITFPFQPAQTQVIKGMAHHQIDGFGAFARALQGLREPDGADFNCAIGGIGAHE